MGKRKPSGAVMLNPIDKEKQDALERKKRLAEYEKKRKEEAKKPRPQTAKPTTTAARDK